MGDFHAISGDTNNNGEMKNAGGQTKRAIHASGVLDFLLDRTALWVGGLRKVGSLRSMAVLSSRAQEWRSREIRARSARERAAKPREK